VRCWHAARQAGRTQNFTFNLAAKYTKSPYSVANFVENSEPHTEARPSARLYAGLTTSLDRALLNRFLGRVLSAARAFNKEEPLGCLQVLLLRYFPPLVRGEMCFRIEIAQWL
jgi:hypothetical protein